MFITSISLVLMAIGLREPRLEGLATAQRFPTDEQIGNPDLTITKPTTDADTSYLDAIFGPAPLKTPWYAKDLSAVQDRFGDINRSESEFQEFETMVRDIEGTIELEGVHLRLMAVGDVMYKIMQTPQQMRLRSEWNLCSQGDTTGRISCGDRCGQSPDTTASPGQCACDLDCFVYGDCCEDINKVYPDVFVEAIPRYHSQLGSIPLAYCFQYGREILEIHKSYQRNTSRESRVFEIHCASRVNETAALANIVDEIGTANCLLQEMPNDQLVTGRGCDKPDVIVCEGPPSSELYQPSFIPIHLMRLDTPYTTRLSDRYRNGFDDMEVISSRGNCYHLRLPSPSQSDNQGQDSTSK